MIDLIAYFTVLGAGFFNRPGLPGTVIAAFWGQRLILPEFLLRGKTGAMKKRKAKTKKPGHLAELF